MPQPNHNEENAKAKLGDVVTIDFKGMIDGVAFKGGTGSDFNLGLGSGQFIPGFEDQLVGAKAGEERIVKVTFPKEYPSAEVAGKEASFIVNVKAIKCQSAPERGEPSKEEISKQLDTLIKTELVPAQQSVTRNTRLYAAALGIGAIAAGALAVFLTQGMALPILPHLAIIGASAIGGMVAAHIPMRGVAKKVGQDAKKIEKIQAITAAFRNEPQQEKSHSKGHEEELAAAMANEKRGHSAGHSGKAGQHSGLPEIAALEKTGAGRPHGGSHNTGRSR